MLYIMEIPGPHERRKAQTFRWWFICPALSGIRQVTGNFILPKSIKVILADKSRLIGL